MLLTSTLVIILVSIGLLNRSNKVLHISLMSTAFLIDLSLVLVIEVKRHAIETVLSQPGAFVYFHVTVSSLVLLLYITLGFIGFKMAKLSTNTNGAVLLNLHTQLAKVFIVLRLINYVTSFYMV